MTPLLVLRHAPTRWNAEKRIQGRADLPLSPEGRRIAAGWRIPAGWEDAACVASPLRRATETAVLLGFAPAPEPALLEMAWGAWEGRTLPALRAELGLDMAANEAAGLDFRAPGGESPREVQARLVPWLASLERPTIAVTHKGVVRALFALATGWTMQGDPPEKLRSSAAHLFHVSGGRPDIVQFNIPLDR